MPSSIVNVMQDFFNRWPALIGLSSFTGTALALAVFGLVWGAGAVIIALVVMVSAAAGAGLFVHHASHSQAVKDLVAEREARAAAEQALEHERAVVSSMTERLSPSDFS
jgi:hypothetical protein